MIQVFNPLAFLLFLVVPALVYICVRTYDKVTPLRKGLMTAVRSAVVVVIIADLLALRVWWTDTKQQLCVYYLVDLSTSMQPHRKALAELVKESLSAKKARTWAGVIAFDAKPTVLVPAGQNPDIDGAVTAIEGGDSDIARSASAEEQETNIAAAIRLAISSFPSDMAKRICLISDCNETEGNAIQEALVAGKVGVDIVALEPKIKAQPDIAIDRVTLAEEIHLNQAFQVRVPLTSSYESPGEGETRTEVRLYRNHVMVASKPVEVKRGSQSIEFRQRLERGGRFVYEARLVTTLKQNPENDRAYAYLELKDLPRVLVVANEPAEQRNLSHAFRDARVSLDVRPARGLPQSMLDLQEFAAVIIGNVPASDMTSNQMKLLHDYVKEFGGSAVLTGGDKALSAGGYAGTLLEDMLPVLCSFGEKETPTSALIVVVDSSTSMRIQKRDFKGDKQVFAKRLFASAVEVLSDRDRLGAVGFASELKSPKWFLPLQQVVDRPRMKQASIRFEDRSNLYRPMNAAFQKLVKVNATNKGILIVTDGFVEPGYDYAQLAMQFSSGEVAISCVAVGSEANHKLLREIARWGNGRYYRAEDVEEATQVLEREIEEFARAVVVERPVDALALKDSELFSGVDIDLSPTLFGYVRVKPKLAAETLLVTQKAKDPLLITWPYGAGRSTVLATDVRGKWSQLWISDWMEQFGQLWQNLVEWSSRPEPGIDYVPDVEVRGWELLLEADALDARNKFVNDQPPKAGLYPLGEKGQLFSEESRIEIGMTQTGPGRYEARHKVDRSGVYLFKVAREDGTGVATTGAVVSVRKELASLLPNVAMREKLCEVSQGRLAESPSDVFNLRGSAKKRPHDIGSALLLIACLLFVLDVLARRWPAVVEFFERRKRNGAT